MHIMLQGSVLIGFNNVLGLSVKIIMFFLSDHNNVAQQIPFMEQPLDCNKFVTLEFKMGDNF